MFQVLSLGPSIATTLQAIMSGVGVREFVARFCDGDTIRSTWLHNFWH